MSEFNTTLNDSDVKEQHTPESPTSKPLSQQPSGYEFDRHSEAPWLGEQQTTKLAANIDAGPDSKLRLAAIEAADNPLLEAAQPLLLTLANIPSQLDSYDNGIESLRELLIREVHIYQTLCDQANLRREHVLAVRYCLCTALDEAANKTSWGGGGAWARKSLLIVFHNESYGGEKIFLLIGRLSPNPQEYSDVLEVIYRILSLGFEGRYSVRPDGRKQLDLIRQQLLSIINSGRDPVARELSPHWLAEASGKLRRLRIVPVWIGAVFFMCLLLTVFAWFKFQIVDADTRLQQRIAAIGKAVPPPASTRVLRLKALLKNEIERGLVSVSENAQQSQVTFLGDFMFVPGKKTVNPQIIPVLDKVASEINKVSGTVTVTGHTDNQPIHTAEFPSNQVLSEKRAAEVAALLTNNGVAESRLKIVGLGDSAPVDNNNTAEGRAKNRRVDIVVTE
ncbi:type VI secretion system protein TssL, long form [Snodgrassella communis]|uniref:type VI secretion system protein TssL, long form n=1 Tax=Snodgrassella communis TaxID=2946699 RepID=UPI001EF4E6BC|nr:type VI secretion system protein TssL, long form [Snodgrassella communis]